MKYMVMECHPAYAILMDEASRLVHAANLHYEVGQIVESPVLLQNAAPAESRPRFSVTMKRCLAAAACMVLLTGAGLAYYRGNYMTYTTIVVSAAADVSMDVSRSGKVLAVHALNDDAAQLLSDYDCRGKDKRTVTNELIGRAIENGYVSAGDTVYVYLDTDKTSDYESYRTELEEEIAAHDLTADVKEYQEKSQPTTPPETPAPTENTPVTETTAAATEPTAKQETATEVQDATESAEEPTEKTIPRWDDNSSWSGWGNWYSWDPWGFHEHWYYGADDDDDDDDDDDVVCETRPGWGRHNWEETTTEADEDDDHDDDDDDRGDDDGEDTTETQSVTEEATRHGQHGWYDDDYDDDDDDDDDDDWQWETDAEVETYPAETYPYIENPPIATHPRRGWDDDDDDQDVTEYQMPDEGWWNYRYCPYPEEEAATETSAEDPTEPAVQETAETTAPAAEDPIEVS